MVQVLVTTKYPINRWREVQLADGQSAEFWTDQDDYAPLLCFIGICAGLDYLKKYRIFVQKGNELRVYDSSSYLPEKVFEIDLQHYWDGRLMLLPWGNTSSGHYKLPQQRHRNIYQEKTPSRQTGGHFSKATTVRQEDEYHNRVEHRNS